ncbi:hypothetical protein DENSPDRAFT_831172 [Dentipellis sp. KUC8613]|nr:hypothetical protein DENSPDRAFT_831172 [Dentipellis sp. KUC8613]
MFPFFLLLVPAVCAVDFRLLHRIHHPSLPSDLFLERGSLRLDDASTHASFSPAPDSDTDLRSFVQTALQLDDALYQLALVSAADAVDAPSHVSSVKAVRPVCSRPRLVGPLTRP